MPGPCQRLRLPSLASVMRQSRGGSEYNAASHHHKEQRRIVVMGGAKVGKTCIISQFLYDKFQNRYKQTVEELHRGEYDLPDGSALTLDILDTSGSYEFPAMRTLSITTAGAFLLVYSVDDIESWREVERLRNQVSEFRYVNLFFWMNRLGKGKCRMKYEFCKTFTWWENVGEIELISGIEQGTMALDSE